MCIGIPMRVREIRGEIGIVEQGGVSREVSLLMVEDVQLGDYVLVHAGFALQKLDPQLAEETISLIQGLIEGLDDRETFGEV